MRSADARVVIIDDHDLYADAITIVLGEEGFPVSRLCLATCGDVLAATLAADPGIALLDLDLGPYGDGAELIAPLTISGVDVLVVTAIRDRATWGGCIRAGARGVVSKSGSLDALVAAVRRQSQGLCAMPRDERDALVEIWRRERAGSDATRERFARLTTRERQVLGDLLEGRAVHDIAAVDVVSEATVRTQVKSILAKLEVSSQLAAVVLAHRIGWHSTSKQEAS